MRSKVPLVVPDFPPAADVAAEYAELLDSDRYSNYGPKETAFSTAIAARVGVAQAVTFASASAGLMAAILALIGRGDGSRSILLPSFTFAAVAQVVQLLGYRVAFVDIEADSLGVDASAITESPSVAALLFCNAFGVGSHRVDEWEAAAARLGVPLIIDSAAGFGSEYGDGSPLGTRGACEVFSFHATKSLAIGEGGAVVTRDPVLADRLRSTGNFGFDAERLAVRAGFNGKLAELPAAIGLLQLQRIDAIISARQKVLGWYCEQLPLVTLQRDVARASLCFLAVTLDESVERSAVVSALEAAGIESRTYYAPSLHQHPQFADAELAGTLTVTESIGRRVLALPCHARVTEDDVAVVADAIAKGLR